MKFKSLGMRKKFYNINKLKITQNIWDEDFFAFLLVAVSGLLNAQFVLSFA